MTKMMSAHSICSDDNGTFAPFEMPAESVSIPGQVEKICSAVGLRSRLALQMKSTLVTLALVSGDGAHRRRHTVEPETQIAAAKPGHDGKRAWPGESL
jgi:hypothetical protein